VFGPNVASAQGIGSDAERDRARGWIYIDARLRRSANGHVASRAEHRLDVHHRTANFDSVEQFSRRWHCDGCQDTDNGERDGDFSYGERVSQRRISSPGMARWIAYDRYAMCR